MSKYQGPKGTNDIFSPEINQWQQVEAKIRQFAKNYQLQEIRTPEFEHTEVFARQNDSSDVVNKEMYTFLDKGNRSITLRPEGTAGVVRSYIEHKLYTNAEPLQRFYYIDSVFRYERPQKGRLRIHHQFGVEFIGHKSPAIDVEAIMLAISFIESFGLKKYKLVINSLGDQASRKQYSDILKAHFKDHLAELCPDCKRRYEQNTLRILDCKVDKELPIVQSAPKLNQHLTPDAKAYFVEVCNLLDACHIPYEIDPTLVRGFDYYTDTVFEIVPDDDHLSNQSTIIGGGRYDDLVSELGGPATACFGFGCGIERFLLNLAESDISLAQEQTIDAYIILLTPLALTTALPLAINLRNNNLSVEYDVANRSLKAQFKSAARLNAKQVIILGEDELKQQTAIIKDQKTQQQQSVHFENILDYLKENI